MLQLGGENGSWELRLEMEEYRQDCLNYAQHRGRYQSSDLPAFPCSDLAEQRGLSDHICHVNFPGHRLGQRKEGMALERQVETVQPETQVQNHIEGALETLLGVLWKRLLPFASGCAGETAPSHAAGCAGVCSTGSILLTSSNFMHLKIIQT